MKNSNLNKISALAIGALASTSLTAGTQSIFESNDLGSGAELRTQLLSSPIVEAAEATSIELKCGKKTKEAKCGEKTKEAKCGEKTKEAKCGEKTKEAKCGEKTKEAKCGEGKCGEGKAKEAKCGEGKCGEGKAKESKCGEGKCGE